MNSINFNLTHIWKRLDKQFFSETSAHHWAFFRIGTALVALILMFSIKADLLDLYGKFGYLQSELIDVTLTEYQLRLSYLMSWLHIPDTEEVAFLNGVYWTYIGTLVCLFFGFLTRFAAILGLFLQLLFLGSGSAFNYGGDYFIANSLFYCMLFPVGNRFSIDSLLFKQRAPVFRIYTLVLQIHLCFIYFFAGFSKSLGTTWFNGEALWRCIMALDFRAFDLSFMANYPNLLSAMGISIVVLELGYSVFIWIKRTQRLWLVVTVLMHIGIAVFMKLWFFAAILIVWNMTAWGVKQQSSFVTISD
jgi:hypothetical protein